MGAHKIWIARFYPAYEENTVVISNGFASMGFGIPAAISAKLLFPDKNVVAAVGDGGFLMSMCEINTAVIEYKADKIETKSDGSVDLTHGHEKASVTDCSDDIFIGK